MLNILLSNFVTMGMIIGFGLQLLTSDVFEKRVVRLFTIGISMIFLLVIVDMVDTYLALQPTLNNWRYVTSAIGYIIRPAFVGIIISIVLRNTKRNYILWLPIIVLSIIVITSPLTHLVFYFNENNEFFRGPFGLISHFMSGIYLIMLLIISIRMYRSIDKSEMFTILYILVFHATATSLESILGIGFLLTGAMITSIAIYYIYLYVQVYKFDVLTGLLNRRSFYTDALSLNNNQLAVISIDMNDLKVINDTRGHAEGDIAIRSISNILRSVAKKCFYVYRIGGDEFMVLGVNQNIEKSNEFIKAVQIKLKETEYSVSMGCALYKPGDNFDEVCVEADMNMYNEKKKYKEMKKGNTDYFII